MADYKRAYIRLAGAAADAVEEIERLESRLGAMKTALILVQREAEELIVNAEDSPIEISI